MTTLLFETSVGQGDIPPVVGAPSATNIDLGVVYTDTFIDVDLLTPWQFIGAPTLVIQEQSGPGTAAIVGSGSGQMLRIPLNSGVGAKSVRVRLTATGNIGFSDGIVTASLQDAPPIPPVARDDVFSGIIENTGHHLIDVIANDDHDGSGVITIDSQSGPDTATIVSNKVDIPTDGDLSGAWSVTYRLTDSFGSDTAILSGTVQATPPTYSIQAGTISDLNNYAGNPLVPGLPADVVAGDWLVCHVHIYSLGGNISVQNPSGMDLVASNTSENDSQDFLFAKQATGAEPSTFSMAWTGTGASSDRLASARVYRIRGHNATDIVGSATNGTGVTINASALTTVDANRTALMFGAIRVTGPTAAAVGDISGESGGSWTNEIEGIAERAVQSVTMVLWAANLASATTITGGTATTDSPGSTGKWSTLVVSAGISTDIPEADPPFVFDVTRAPEFYGAVGDGSTNDQSAIQQLFTWAGAGSSSDIRLMDFGTNKTYMIGSRIALSGSAYFAIRGNGATIKRRPGFDISNGATSQMIRLSNCSNFDFRDITIDGNRYNVSTSNHDEKADCLRFEGCHDHYMLRVTCKEAHADGLHMRTFGDATDGVSGFGADNFGKDGTFKDCVFTRAGRNCASLEYLRRMTFIGCEFSYASGRAPGDGCDLEPYVSNPGGVEKVTSHIGNEDITFNGCRFLHNDGGGLQTTLVGGGTAFSIDINILDCVFEDNGRNMAAFGGAMGHLGLKAVDNVLVQGCSFLNQTVPSGGTENKTVIYIQRTNSHIPSNVIIEFCSFSGNTGCAHLIRSARRLSSVIDPTGGAIRSCLLDASTGLVAGTTGSESRGPAIIALQVSGIVVGPDNTFIGNGPTGGITGVKVENTAGTSGPNGVVVANNETPEGFVDCDIGIHLATGSGHTTSPNSFSNCGDDVI